MQHSSCVFYSETNFFLPPAPNHLVLHYSYSFLKLSSFSLADSTIIWLADAKCLGHTYMPCISQLGVAVPHSSPAVAASRRRVCLHGCVRPGEEEAAGCWYWDLAEPASGPSKLLLCRVVFLYPLVVSGRERALPPEAVQRKPLALLSLQWLGDEYIMAKLHCFPLPQSNGSTSLCIVSLLHLINSVSECQKHMLWSVRHLLSLPRGLCSSCPTLFSPALLQESLQGTLHLKRLQLESDTHSHTSTAASVLSCVFEQDYIWPKWWESISSRPGLPQVQTSIALLTVEELC